MTSTQRSIICFRIMHQKTSQITHDDNFRKVCIISTALMSITLTAIVTLLLHHHSWYIVADATYFQILYVDGVTIINLNSTFLEIVSTVWWWSMHTFLQLSHITLLIQCNNFSTTYCNYQKFWQMCSLPPSPYQIWNDPVVQQSFVKCYQLWTVGTRCN